MSKIQEQIVRSLNTVNNTVVTTLDQVEAIRANTAYLVPNKLGSHDRWVCDQVGVLNKQGNPQLSEKISNEINTRIKQVHELSVAVRDLSEKVIKLSEGGTVGSKTSLVENDSTLPVETLNEILEYLYSKVNTLQHDTTVSTEPPSGFSAKETEHSNGL